MPDIVAGTGRTYLLTVDHTENEVTLCNTINTFMIRVVSGESVKLWFPTDTSGNYWTMQVGDSPLGPIYTNSGTTLKLQTAIGVITSQVEIIGWG